MPETTSYGGNQVLTLSKAGGQVFAAAPYHYRLEALSAPGPLPAAPALASYTVYVLTLPSGARLVVDGKALSEGDAVQIEAASPTIEATTIPAGRAIEVLIAGTAQASGCPAGVTVTAAADLKKVAKPWGHELWINGEHPGYAVKQIFLKAGNRTSLQYHRMKRETNVLFGGRIALHYKSNPAADNDAVGSGDLGTVALDARTSVDVFPNHLHRIEALSETLLYEVSTPHLDDVVRVSDDAKRPDGRIASEHVPGRAPSA